MRPQPINQNLPRAPRAKAAVRMALLGLALAAVSAGCVYRINIQQGNFLDADKVQQLAAGMTRSQVRYLLGSPIASTPFDSNRWDYVYYFRRGHSSKYEERKVTVFFEGDKVTRIEHPKDTRGRVTSAV